MGDAFQPFHIMHKVARRGTWHHGSSTALGYSREKGLPQLPASHHLTGLQFALEAALDLYQEQWVLLPQACAVRGQQLWSSWEVCCPSTTHTARRQSQAPALGTGLITFPVCSHPSVPTASCAVPADGSCQFTSWNSPKGTRSQILQHKLSCAALSVQWCQCRHTATCCSGVEL